MKKELPKVYEPREVEGRVYEMWEKNGCFEGHRDPDKRPFTIVMPPPNVTGQLHIRSYIICHGSSSARISSMRSRISDK